MKNVTYINAGAGSGKTYTLTTLLADELSNNKVKPSQVILTTFTELAAAEFHEKAREQILAKGNLEAAAQIDGAVIGTVHSMAFHFVRKFWYLLDYGADIQPISERDDDFYRDQSLARIVQERGTGDELKYKQHLENFRNFRDYFDITNDNRPDYLFWQPILKDVVEKMEYYEVNNVRESIDKSVDTIRSVYKGPSLDPQLKDDLVDYLKKHQAFLKNEGSDKANRQTEEISTILTNFDFNLVPTLKVVNDPVKPAKIEQLCPGYNDFHDKALAIPVSVSHQDILIPFVTSIFELAAVWRSDFNTYKRENHIISYNDMEQLFLKLLKEEPEVQDYIREHYRLVMVDEFQDSNPIQLKIFNELSELVGSNEGGRSYWVGDPKQSIYGFRGADTELVSEVSGKFTFYDDDVWHIEPSGLGSRRLVKSWRSRAQLVELVNATFEEPFKVDGIDSKLITLTPQFTSDHPEVTYDPVVHWECKEGNKELAATALAAKVKELLDSHVMVHHEKLDKKVSGISPYDVAILCRTNANAKAIVKALRKFGVPVSEPEDSIMQRVEVQLVVTLLQFMQNPAQKHVRADLLRLLKGMKTEEILVDRLQYLDQLEKENGEINDDILKEKDIWLDDDTLFKELKKLTDRFKHLSIPEMVDGLIYECDIPVLADSWGDGAIRRQNLSTLRKLAADYDQRCLQLGLGTSITGFIFFLNSNEPDKSPDNLSDTVKVLTYHRSKGLEWSSVVLTDLNNDALNDNECIKKSFMKVFEVDKKTNLGDPFHKDYYLHYFPFVLKGARSNPDSSLANKIKDLPLYKDIKKKVGQEERRLMYVGMTRAKDRLVTFGRGGNNSNGEPSAAQINEFNWLRNVGVVNPTPENVWDNNNHVSVYEDASAVTPPSVAATLKWNKVVKPEVHTDFDNRYLSPSKIERFEEWQFTKYQQWADSGSRMSTSGWGSDYATIGSCIHDFFAVFRPGKSAVNEGLAKSILAGYGLTTQLSGSVGDIVASAEWLYRQLHQQFPQTENDRVEMEVPFQLTLAKGQTLRGEMDLLWFYTDGDGQHCVLVDYKTFPGVDYAKHTQSHYPQLSAYAQALRQNGIDVTHTLIYYPVGEVLHELE